MINFIYIYIYNNNNIDKLIELFNYYNNHMINYSIILNFIVILYKSVILYILK